jgi:hypothetical protein
MQGIPPSAIKVRLLCNVTYAGLLGGGIAAFTCFQRLTPRPHHNANLEAI